MKKKLLIMASILTLLLIVIAIPVNAADATSNVNSQTAHRGDTVTFEATLANGIVVGSGGVSLSYDNTVLRLVSGEWKVSGTLLSSFDMTKEVGAFAFMASTEISGTIFSATFEILDTADFGTTDVGLIIQLRDGSNADILIANNSGSITVECLHDFSVQDTSSKYLKSSANCTSPAIYYYSCANCGVAGTATFESGSTIPHSYKKQVISDAYLKTPASCTTKAVYYYCCETCDAKGTENFEYGEALAHTFDQQNTSEKYLKSGADCENAAVYYKSCSCGEMGTETFTYGDKLGHTGGTATCTSKAICSRCGKEYGDLLSHTYNQEKATEEYFKSGATCTQKAVYFKSCTCGAKGTITFEYGTTLPHTYDQKVITNTYLKSAATCTAKAVYYYSCTCGAKGTDTFEVGDEPSHSYKTVWSSNSKEHWHECSKCGDKKDIVSHTPGAEATEYTAQTCTVCGYVITPALGHTHNYGTDWNHDSTNHWHDCSGCDERADEAKHVYDNACDATCNVCDYVRTVTHSYTTKWMQDGSNHWHECTVCHEKSDEANHIPGAEATATTAQTCMICGYVIKDALGHIHSFGVEWKSDATTHWHECTCGEKSEQASHVSTGDNIASCTKKAVCDICGDEYGEMIAHKYSSDWKSDADEHWHECACGDKSENGTHTWDEGTVIQQATTTEDGVKKYTCTVCGQEKVESIDRLPNSNEAIQPTDNTKTIYIAVGIIGVLTLAIVILVLIVKKRKNN